MNIEFLDDYEYTLIELDPCIVKELHDLEFKGVDNDSAVLVSKDSTFAVRQVLTSNTLLVVPSSNQDSCVQIYPSSNSYMELTRINPRLDRLYEALENYQYQGMDHEQRMLLNNPDHASLLSGLTMDSLCHTVQASAHEIRHALSSVNAVEIEGSYRILEKAHLYSILKLVFLTCQEMEWTLQCIPIQELISSLSLQDIPQVVGEIVLKSFSSSSLDTPHVCLDEHKIARFIGEYLLIFENMNGLRLSLFLNKWKETCPEDVTVSMDHLQGLALIETESSLSSIRYFPKSLLDSDPKARFKQLFQARKMWNRKDLLPYISDLVDSEKKMDVLLLKYARSVKENGAFCYFAR